MHTMLRQSWKTINNQTVSGYETPWKDNRSRRVSKIDEAAAFCENVNFRRPSNSPSLAWEAASAASFAMPIRA